MYVGDKILELRKSKGYSQEDIANKLNVSRQTVSKWETNQSMPDFDKIVPLCNLFGITTDELLMNKVQDKKIKTENDINSLNEEELKFRNKKKFAFSLCLSILLYFVSVMWIIFAEAINIKEELNIVTFLGIVAVATVIIVYSSILYSKSKEEEEKEKKQENVIAKTINGIMGLVFSGVYLYISFMTMAWEITWIIWIVYAIFVKIVELVFMLKEVKDE